MMKMRSGMVCTDRCFLIMGAECVCVSIMTIDHRFKSIPSISGRLRMYFFFFFCMLFGVGIWSFISTSFRL